MSGRRLTEVAHAALAAVLADGARAIDATVGNGHDTLFLASRVGPGGRVIGFDVQPRAIDAAAARLGAAGVGKVVTLHHAGHEQMLTRIPAEWCGTVAAITFNLGYLPGGDKSWVTQPASTVDALQQAASMLRREGLQSVMVYHGHPGAAAEARAVEEWITGLDAAYRVTCHRSPGPTLYLVERLL